MASDSDAHPDDSLKNYTLLAILGDRPQVLTELIWHLADKDNVFPERIIVLTTARGEETLRVRLLGEDLREYDRYCENRWEAFCDQVLESDPFDTEDDIKVPYSDDGPKIEDIDDRADGRLFENWCFDLVRSLTWELDGPPLYGCIAGGRKTMTQDVTTAFTLYARRDDRLFHVIVPKYLEDKPEFFWPRADLGHDKFADDVHRVDKRFPRLRARLEEGLLSEISDDVNERSHYKVLLDALEGDFQALTTPKSVTLHIKRSSSAQKDSDSTLAVFDATGEPLTKVDLTLKPLITLLFLWNEIWSRGEQKHVSRKDLKTEDVDKERKKLYEIFLGREPVTSRKPSKSDWVRWSSHPPGEWPCSSAISDLKTKMEEDATLERYFLVSKRPKPSDFKGQKPVYAFPDSLPDDIDLDIEVVPDERDKLLELKKHWPFENLPPPDLVDE